MAAIGSGSLAPPIPGIVFGKDPVAVFFYKVTCPVCQMAAPKVQTFEESYPGRIVGVGQDPPDKLTDFSRSFGIGFPSIPDLPPYDASNAFGIRVVPTMFVVGTDGTVLDAVESWDRDGFNRLSASLADLLHTEFVPVSDAGDGLPAFRPG